MRPGCDEANATQERSSMGRASMSARTARVRSHPKSKKAATQDGQGSNVSHDMAQSASRT